MDTDVPRLARRLYDLLPAVYRVRDAELAAPETAYTRSLQATDPEGAELSRRPLFNLITIIAEQTAAVQESLEQAYDDAFIETCAETLTPYIGDLIGYHDLHRKGVALGNKRAQVANILSLRQRKGTISAIEQIARDVTGRPAVAVEFFQRLAQTQFMNHVRENNRCTLDLRDELALETLVTPFDGSARTVEVRRISSLRGRYHIPNVGLFLHRIRAYSLTRVHADKVDDFRYLFNPLGIDGPLYNDPLPESDITALAKPANIPSTISRLLLERAKDQYYGVNASLAISIRADGDPVAPRDVLICNLSDKSDGSGDWIHAHRDKYAIDPVLGRLALPTDTATFPVVDQRHVTVIFHYGFSDDIGGGEYERGVYLVRPATRRLNAASPDVQAVLSAITNGGVVEFDDSQTYRLRSATPNLAVTADATCEIRASNHRRPLLRLEGGDFVIHGGQDSHIVLSGLVITGGALRITGNPKTVELLDCTFVPGLARSRTNEPVDTTTPSIVITSNTVSMNIERCIVGRLQTANGAVVRIRRTIVDATDSARDAYNGGVTAGESLPGGVLDIERSTIIGRVHTRHLIRAENAIFYAVGQGGVMPVRSSLSQEGCVRFSAVPAGSRTPQRYRCTTEQPSFVSLRFGRATYCQLSLMCDKAICEGASDGGEMGVFHDLHWPHHLSDLHDRMSEFMRYGMDVGLFFAS